MPAPVLIVGQGLAGTLLARALETRRVGFVIADAGHERAASRVGAGIINPVTGLRMVKSADVDRLLPDALSMYREFEYERGRTVLREMKVRRAYVDPRERAELLARVAAGKLAPYVRGENEACDGFVIEPAWRVDLPALIAGERDHWKRAGRLEERVVTSGEADAWSGPLVWCDGAGAVARGESDLAPVHGSSLEIRTEALEAGAILNRGGRWLLPLDERTAWVGATYSREGPEEPDAAHAELERTTTTLLGARARSTCRLMSGVRMTTADRRPVVAYAAGRGRINGLGSKGALYAPSAAMWVAEAIVAEAR